MNNKVLKISDEINQMELFFNTHNKIAIKIWYNDLEEEFMIIELDKNDSIELIKELKKLIKLF